MISRLVNLFWLWTLLGTAWAWLAPAHFTWFLGIILVSCCPGGTASNVVTYLARGNLALSVLMTTCSTLLAVLLTPFLTKLYAAQILDVPAGKMVVSMIMIVLLPIILGLLLNHFLSSKLDRIKQAAPLVSILVIVLIVAAVVGATKPSIQAHWKSLLPAVFLVHIIGFFVGYLWGRIFKIPERECRTFSIEVGMQNSGLGSQLAKTHFSLLAAAPCAISAFYHCMIGSFLASLWSRKASQKNHQEVTKGS